MKNAMTLSQKALVASLELHKDLTTECCYAGYDADKEAFDRLYDEVLVICRDEVPDDADIDYICEVFHQYQLEQMNDERAVDWYLYQ